MKTHSEFVVYNKDYSGVTWMLSVKDNVKTGESYFTWSLNGNILTSEFANTVTFEISINEDELHLKRGPMEYFYHKVKD